MRKHPENKAVITCMYHYAIDNTLTHKKQAVHGLWCSSSSTWPMNLVK